MLGAHWQAQAPLRGAPRTRLGPGLMERQAEQEKLNAEQEKLKGGGSGG
jgi:hypothetical protein